MLPLKPLDEPPGPFLRRHVEGDARKLAVDVECTLQLEEVPVLHDHLGLRPCHPVLEKRNISNVCLSIFLEIYATKSRRVSGNVQTFLMTSLRKMISVSFMVRSSSLVPDFRSLTTDGRMQRGGTRRRVRRRSAGVPASGFISSSGTSS